MRAAAVTVVILALAGTPVRAADLGPHYSALARSLTDTVALPAYRKLTNAFRTLTGATAVFCDTSGAEGHDRLVSTFAAAMSAWQHAQPISFGPVLENSRAQRIEFWPDSGGSTARQIRRALAAKDMDLMAPGALEGKSVALQSLSTYERLLTNNAARLAQGKGTDTDRYACTLMTAIARFQSGTADALETEWSSPGGYRDHIRAADAKTAAQDYFRAFVGTLDAIIQQKLERPMGESAADARPKRAESWRTGRSLDNIEANLETLRAMFAVKDGFADLLRAAGQGPLADTMIQSFDRTLGRIRAIPKPLSVALTDPDLRPKIEDILVEVKALRKLSTGPVAEGIGLIVGFNALDGD